MSEEIQNDKVGLLDWFFAIKEKLSQSFYLRLLFSTILCVVIFSFIFPYLMDNSALKLQIEKHFSESLDSRVIIKGKVKVNILPVVSIQANDVIATNINILGEENKKYDVYINKLEVRPKILKIFSGFEISKIVFDGAKILSYYDLSHLVSKKNNEKNIIANLNKKYPKSKKNYNKIVKEGIASKIFDFSTISNITWQKFLSYDVLIKNSKLFIYDKSDYVREFALNNINLNNKKSGVFAKGAFALGSDVSNFTLSLKYNIGKSDKSSSFLRIISPSFNLDVSGLYAPNNTKKFSGEFKGKIKAKILNFRSFYSTFVTGNASVIGRLKESQVPIAITANIENDDKSFLINDILFQSNIISGSANLEKEHLLNRANVVDLQVNLSALNLDEVLNQDPVGVRAALMNKNDIEFLAGETFEVLNKSRYLKRIKKESDSEPELKNDNSQKSEEKPKEDQQPSFNAEINISNVKFGGSNLKDVNLYIVGINENQTLVMPLLFRFPGGGDFRMNGIIDSSAGFPRFIAKMDAKGEGLGKVASWFFKDSSSILYDSLTNFSINGNVILYPNQFALSKAYLVFGEKQSEIAGDIEVDVSSKPSKVVTDLKLRNINLNEHLSTSNNNYFTYGSLLEKFFWLNDVNRSSNIGLTFDKVKYFNSELSDQSLVIKLGRGFFGISDFEMYSNQNKLKAELNIDISKANPTFNIKVVADSFYYKDKKGSGLEEAKESVGIINEIFNLPSFEGLNGKVQFEFGKLNINNREIRDLKVESVLYDGVIRDFDLYANVYDGSLHYKGSAVIKRNKSVSGVLSLNSIKVQPILIDLMGINNISGFANVSASISSSATNSVDFISRLSGELKYSASGLKVGGYGMNDLVKKMFVVPKYEEELKNPDLVLYNPDAITIFNDSSGVISFKQNNEAKVAIKSSGLAINSTLNGKVVLNEDQMDLAFSTVFLTGAKDDLIPISVASNIKGSFNDYKIATNLSQIEQYIQYVKYKATLPKEQRRKFKDLIAENAEKKAEEEKKDRNIEIDSGEHMSKEDILKKVRQEMKLQQ